MTHLHLPNHFHYQRGEGGSNGSFGDFYSLDPINYIGAGHHPHLELRCKYGFRAEISTELGAALLRELPRVLAAVSLPRNVRHIRDSVGGSHVH